MLDELKNKVIENHFYAIRMKNFIDRKKQNIKKFTRKWILNKKIVLKKQF